MTHFQVQSTSVTEWNIINFYTLDLTSQSSATSSLPKPNLIFILLGLRVPHGCAVAALSFNSPQALTLWVWRPQLPYGGWAPECPDVKNYKRQLNPVWHGMLYSYRSTYMAAVGVKGLIGWRAIHPSQTVPSRYLHYLVCPVCPQTS